MMKVSYIHDGDEPTKEQLEEIEEAAKYETVYDEDSPELTPEMEKAFRLAAKNRNRLKAM